MRLLAYTDYVYRRSGSAVFGQRAFALFMTEVSRHTEEFTLLGRLHPEPGVGRYPLPDWVRFVALPYHQGLDQPLRAAPTLFRSLRLYWRALDDVDTVWLLGPYLLSIAFAGLALVRRKRVTLGVRQDLPVYARSRHPDRPALHHAADGLEAIYRLMARRCPVVVVGSELARRYKMAPCLLETSVSLIREDSIRTNGSAPPRDYGAETLTVLSVGRLDCEKNPLLLADILHEIRRHDARWRLVVCGEGPLRDALAHRLAELGVHEHAELRGYVPVDQGLMALYEESHAFVHVSLTEGMPQVLLEAFSVGLPVVATAVGGVPDVARGRALLVEREDARAAARALHEIATDVALRGRLTRAGAEYVAEHTLEREAKRVASFLSRPCAHATAGIESSQKAVTIMDETECSA